MAHSQTTEIEKLSWPVSKLSEAVEVLARKCGLPVQTREAPLLPEQLLRSDAAQLGWWIETLAHWLGLEAEPVETTYAELNQLLVSAGPAVLAIPSEFGPRILLLLESRGGVIWLVTQKHTIEKRSVEELRPLLCQTLEAPFVTRIDSLLRDAGVSKRRMAQARQTLLHEQLSAARIGHCWMLRLHPGSPITEHLSQALLHRYFLTLLGIYALQYLFLIGSWWMIGRGMFQGQLDPAWVFAWALLLITMIPFRAWATWTQGLLSVGAGRILKQRLLYGALQLAPEAIRHQGAGQLLGRVNESQAIEGLVLSSGFTSVSAVVELVMALLVLTTSPGGMLMAWLLAGWIVLTVMLSWQYFRHRQEWTENRVHLTNDLVERMVGHRTRVAQELRQFWHDGEDQAVERYHRLSRKLDHAGVRQSLVTRGWLILGIAGLGPAFVTGSATPASLAIGLGGVLLAQRALAKIVSSIGQITGVLIAWKQVAPFFQAAENTEVPSSFFALLSSRKLESVPQGQIVLEADDLVFRYREHSTPVVKECTLQVRSGDRILLEGPSGSGKSTFASLLIGLRSPESGLLLLHGIDRKTLGIESWRKRVASAPQFHENHILVGTFSFNVLLGKDWPPSPEDLKEAETVCHELGLGDLLNRMPAGLLQMVGETGWQLSHGERSRVFIARALLQGADVIILDESFAALDPENLNRVVQCVLKRAPTVLVIAHP